MYVQNYISFILPQIIVLAHRWSVLFQQLISVLKAMEDVTNYAYQHTALSIVVADRGIYWKQMGEHALVGI